MTINVRIRDGMCPDPSTGDGGATEGDIRGSFSDIIDVVGVKDLAGGHCAVTENSPASLSVLVADGIVYIPNADYNELDSNEPKFYEAIIDAEAEVAIGENTSGSTRIDLICVKIDKTITPDKHASNIATLVAVAGTPGAGAPTLPDNYAKLAEVEVANGASTIVNADITNTRVQSKIDFDFLPKATGAEINTGTEDAKIVTPKAIADSYIGNNFLSYQAIINGGFTVNQRGYASDAALAAGVYGHDRWKAGAGGGDYTFTQLPQATTITIKAGKSLIQVVEDKNVIGGTYTLSWTGTAQARFGKDSATPSGAYAASPITITGQTAGTVMSVEFNEGTLGKVVLNSGSVALPFMPKSYEEELRACKRYCVLLNGGDQGSFSPAFGTAATTTIALCYLSLGAEMRTNPTLTATATDWVLSDGANTSIDLTAISIQPTTNSVTLPMIRCEVAAGLTQYRPYFLAADENQNRKLIFSAEL